MTPKTIHHQRRRRPGTILIVTMFIVFTLASLVLVMCGSMRVEAMAAANMAASLQAAAVEHGAEQYVMAILTEQKDTLSDLTEEDFGGPNGGGIQVGDGYFWILRPNYGDDNLPIFGFTEENAKLNINTASYESLMRLPNMTDDVASAIINWRGTATTGTSSSSSGGGQESYYASQPDPYTSKHAPFETVEEMLLVQGASRQLLYGDGTAPPLGTQGTNYQAANGQTTTDLQTANGIYDLLTVFSAEKSAGQQVNINDRSKRDDFRALLEKQLGDSTRADLIVNASMSRGTQYADAFDFYLQNKATVKLTSDEFAKIYNSITTKAVTPAVGATGGAAGGSGGGGAVATQLKGRINVNTAPRDVLLTLPGLEAADVDKLISQRQSSTPGDTSVAWVADILDKKAIGLAERITGKSSQYSADILAVSGNGRGYKHCRIVINTSTTTPQIVYRRDLTERGWPMDPEVLAQFRTGQVQQQGTSAGGRSTMAGGGSFR